MNNTILVSYLQNRAQKLLPRMKLGTPIRFYGGYMLLARELVDDLSEKHVREEMAHVLAQLWRNAGVTVSPSVRVLLKMPSLGPTADPFNLACTLAVKSSLTNNNSTRRRNRGSRRALRRLRRKCPSP
jgi:hypothetical protein